MKHNGQLKFAFLLVLIVSFAITGCASFNGHANGGGTIIGNPAPIAPALPNLPKFDQAWGDGFYASLVQDYSFVFLNAVSFQESKKGYRGDPSVFRARIIVNGNGSKMRFITPNR